MNKMLDVRITDAQEGLKRIRAVVSKATSRRASAAKLAVQLKGLANSEEWGALDGLISSMKRVASEAEDPDGKRAAVIAKAETALDALKKSLKAASTKAEELKESSANNDQLKRHSEHTLSLVENKLEQLHDIQKNGAATPGAMSTVEKVKPIWGEHLEITAGLVLRDDRYDEGLSSLADSLIETCTRSATFRLAYTLNVLGRDQTVINEIGYVVYLRFPAWSIWALPLIAHDFWHVVRRLESFRDDPRLKQAIQGIAESSKLWDDAILQACLADVFATCIIGPSYPYACILLALNPASSHDRHRAHAVFATVHWLRETGRAAHYGFIDDLQACWNQATAACGAKAEEQIAGAPTRSPTARQKKRTPFVETSLLDSWVRAVASFLPDSMRYNTETWSQAGTALARLCSRDLPEREFAREIETLTEGVDIRYVLHAAWNERWSNDELREDEFKQASERVEAVCKAVVTRQRHRQPVGHHHDSSAG